MRTLVIQDQTRQSSGGVRPETYISLPPCRKQGQSIPAAARPGKVGQRPWVSNRRGMGGGHHPFPWLSANTGPSFPPYTDTSSLHAATSQQEVEEEGAEGGGGG
ncbi:hypothetical protein ACOMHN_053414 [Nucella lapillus]